MMAGKGNQDSIRLFNKCRTCLDQSDYLHSLAMMTVVEESREISFGELLSEITQINIKDDNFTSITQYICDCCSHKLKSAHAFIKQARDVNAQLCSLSQQLQQFESIEKTDDCLQESEIDIQTCLEIKMESVENAGANCAAITCGSESKFKAEMNDAFSTEVQIESTQTADDIEDKTTYNASTVDNDSLQDIIMKTTKNETKAQKRSNKGPTKRQGRFRKEKKQIEKNTNDKKEDEDADIAVPCFQCNKIFNNSKELMRHLRNTHLPEDQKCACPICGIKFTRSCNMYKHMRKLHDPESVKELLPTKEKPFECDKCNRRYTQKRQLNSHIKEKHSKAMDENTDKDKELSKLQKKKVSEIRPLCFVCGSSFSNKAHLIVHMTRHTGEKPFSCDLCDRAFPRISDLTIHRRIHTGEKPFKCKLCDKAFRVSTKLANHKRSHTNERPYKCKQCERSFKYSKDLNIHMRIHTGERPYCCTVCGSTFTQSNSLKAHRMKLGHMEDSSGALQPSVMQLVV